MVEQQGVGVRLVGRGGAGGERGAEVAEARGADHPEPGTGKTRPAAIDGVDVAAEDSVRHQQRQPLALIGVLDDPEAVGSLCAGNELIRSRALRMSRR